MSDSLMVFSSDTYHTPEGKAGFWSRKLPTLSFFARVIYIVLKEGRKASKAPYSSEDWVNASLEVLNALEACGVRIEVDGLQNSMNLKEPCVFIANHMSTLETFILPSIIQPHREVTFVVKQSLLDYPVFGAVMRSREPIAVGRKNPRHDLSAVLEGGVEKLNAGKSIIIFPQSTRSDTIDPVKFNTIGVKLAKKANVPIIPIALKTNAWSSGSLVKELGPIYPERTVHFSFGAPLMVTENGKLEHAEILAFISNKLEAWNMPALAE